jgi:hypothetical protein
MRRFVEHAALFGLQIPLEYAVKVEALRKFVDFEGN